MSQRTSAPSPIVRWLTDVTSAVARAGLALDDGRLGAGADPHRQAHMRLAAGMEVLEFDRRLDDGAGGDVEEIAVGHKGRVDGADGVVVVMRAEGGSEGAVDSAGPRAGRHRHAIGASWPCADAMPVREPAATVEPATTGANRLGRARPDHGPARVVSSRRRSV